MPARDPAAVESWLASHPYLDAVGSLHREIEAALDELAAPSPVVPEWSPFLDDFLQGTPVLHARSLTLDLAPAGTMIAALAEALVERGLTGTLAADTGALSREMRAAGMTPGRIATWLTGGDPFTPSNPGLLRYLGWSAMARYLAPVSRSFEAWRDDERWRRGYCPLCGSSPAMAQLSGTDPGRRRLLSCGCCATHWQFRRTACPFCDADSHRLASVTIEGEAGLRIDWCESCKGYLKTYDGEGNERLHLSDWSSLHLDVIALDRGFERRAASLYELTGAFFPAD